MLGRGFAGREPGHGLNPQGHAEARILANTLGNAPITAIISGPLERVCETAAPLAERLGLTVAVDPAFDEIDFGDWTGATFEALHGTPAWAAWNAFRSTAAIPNGETMHAVQARAITAIQRIPGGEVAVFTHSDVIKVVLAHFLGMPLDLFPRIEIAPAARSVVKVFDRDARVDAINLPPNADPPPSL